MINNLSMPSVTTDLDPIIITSPTTRSGTTLLQRLLCSSPDCMIFGENCAEDLELLLGIYLSKSLMYSGYKEKYSERLNAFTGGHFNRWIVDLMPDIDNYLKVLGESCFSGVSYCRDFALSLGRTSWGFKYPGLKPQTIGMIRQMMPRCKLLYIYRDVVDCLKSGKAKGLVRTKQDVQEFCRQWVNNLGFVLGMANQSGLLIVNYLDLTSRTDVVLGHIRAFTGLENISAEVLAYKINSWDIEASKEGERDAYLAPHELSEEEEQIVNLIASGLRNHLLNQVRNR